VAACVLCFCSGGGRRRPGGPKGRVGQLVAGPIGLKARENSFRIKIEFLNLQRLWKFVQGDLGRILMWGFFSKFF
jgi:hypothetical protein